MLKFLFFLLMASYQPCLANESGPTIRLPSDVTSFDWSKTMDLNSARVIFNIMEGLTVIDSSGKLVPAVAKSWKVTDGGKRYTFDIRHDVFWSDGVQLTAQHFVDGIIHLLDPKTGALGASRWWMIRGAKEYSTGKSKDISSIGIKAIRTFALEIELNQPSAAIPGLMAHTISLPVRLDLIAKYGDKWTDPENLVVNGPYKVIEAKNHQLVLSANDKYYGVKPKIKKFRFLVVADDSTALSLFDSKQIDVLYNPPRMNMANLRKKPSFRVYPHIRVTVFAFNVAKPPVDQIKVREALAMAVDRESIGKVLDLGRTSESAAVFEPLKSWIPKGIPGTDDSIGLNFNPKLAQQKLREAGFPDGKNFPLIKLAVDTREEYRLMAERIQENWKNILNIKVEIETRDTAGHLGNIRVDPPHVFRFGIGTIYADPDLFADIFINDGTLNYTRWKSAKYDELVVKGRSELKIEMRKKHYDQAQKLLVENEVVFIPVSQESLPVLVSSRLKNFEVNMQSKPQMAAAEFE